MKKILCVILISSLFILGGCVDSFSPNIYSVDDAGVASRVKKGKVISKRTIKIQGKSGVGTVAGAVAGGAAGTAIGGSTQAGIVGAVGGAVAAGAIGNEIDKAINTKTGYEYIIKLEDGKTIAVAQEQSVELTVGQKVLIIYGATTRVVPDNTK